MKPERILIPALVLFLLGACSTAQERNAAADDPEVTAKTDEELAEMVANDPNRISCQAVRPTGSRIAKRVCMTAAQWDEARQEAQDMSDAAKQIPGVVETPTDSF